MTGFTGPKGRPLELTPEEVQRMKLERRSYVVDLEEGDRVEVVDGPLSTMIGTIISVDAENARAKVNVEMFGRETAVDLDYSQIRKIQD